MLFQNFSIRCNCNRFVASLLTSCENAVPTTCQQDVFAIGFLASLLTICGNAVLTTCQQDAFIIGL
jgi:hypothetical protein